VRYLSSADIWVDHEWLCKIFRTEFVAYLKIHSWQSPEERREICGSFESERLEQSCYLNNPTHNSPFRADYLCYAGVLQPFTVHCCFPHTAFAIRFSSTWSFLLCLRSFLKQKKKTVVNQTFHTHTHTTHIHTHTTHIHIHTSTHTHAHTHTTHTYTYTQKFGQE
jgi:hypothetical protein